MTAQERQVTCIACGKPLPKGVPLGVEPMIDPSVRYAYTCPGCSSFPHRRRTMAP